MSAFLGPIHNWLFRKIQFQEMLTGKIIDFSEKQNPELQLRNRLREKYGELEQAPLESVIDERNIHGWLQERVSMVEKRYADAVTSMLNHSDCTLQTLEKRCFVFGSEHKPKNFHTATELFQYLHDILLDGMPCDRVNDMLSQNSDKVVWKRNTCVHKKAWEDVGGEIAIYYLLRDALIQGMLEHTEFVYEKSNENQYTIQRRAS